MKFSKPKFWDKRGRISLFSILLLPLSLIAIIKNHYENAKLLTRGVLPVPPM